ncbi:efflux RND transporter permease subunit [Rubrivirga litoralis]|uniref:Efflux RND transporter permease subunit n=1 Tax=Rubrivirga litoralis TaxID=3075598 RepID=A0ABU3BRL5_9BACT|nr:efflux RND transporter permease subunit [Rubrivirga sp. F394]MDT0631932.1 efflux RND transporter permease subunit [Rubrivirga sp. F394]
MTITNTAVAYRTAVVVLTLLLFAGGLYAYVALPKESNPSISIPQLIVTTVYPGASPEDVAELVTRPVEQELQGISGIDEIRSTSSEGVSSVVAEFTTDTEIDDAKQDLRERVDAAQSELPADAEDPVITEIDLDAFPIMTINLAAEYPVSRLKAVAEDLQEEIETVPGVLEVDLVGGLEREVQVDVDRTALQAYNLTLSDLTSTIQGEDVNLPGGSIDVGRENYLVRVDGQITDPALIEDLVLKAPGGTPVYVRDVATVTFGFEDPESYSRLQVLQREVESGEFAAVEDTGFGQVVSLSVKKKQGGNVIEVADGVRALLDDAPIPSGTQVLITGDQSEQVETLVKDLENNIIAGILFVVLVLLFFLGVRTAALVGIAIPLSMLVSFLVFLVMGTTLNMVVLFSLIIALGMLVDNAVVVVENIYRFVEEGYERWEAVRLGVGEVGGAVVASTATTLGVFGPMLFWPGLIGEFMSYLPLTLIVTLTSSLFVALVINPVITGYFVQVEGDPGDGAEQWEPSPWTRRAAAAVVVLLCVFVGIVNPVSLLVLAVAVVGSVVLYRYAFKPVATRFVSSGLPRLTAAYRRFLAWMLERDYTVERAFLRNTGVFFALTAGLVLLVLGGLAFALAGTAGLALVVPGGVLLALGVVGVFVLTGESLFLGGWTTVKAGLAFGAVMLGIQLAVLAAGNKTFGTIAVLMAFPGAIVALGALGAVFGRGRRTLILTDNRARLLAGTLGAFFGVIVMFAVAPTGVEFFPESDPSQIQITLEAPLGTNVEASDDFAREAQARVDALLTDQADVAGNVQNVLVGVGVGGGGDFGGGQASAERSRVTLNMVDYAAREESSAATLRRVREAFGRFTGVEVEIDQTTTGPATGPPVNLEVSGPDFDRLGEIAREFEAALKQAAETGAVAGLVDVTSTLNAGRPEERVVIDRERAAAFGLSTQLVASVIRTAIAGQVVTTYREGKDEYDVRVRLEEDDRGSLDALRSLTIPHEGEQIPLVSVASFETGAGLGSITRIDLDPVVTIEGQAASGFAGGEVLAGVQALLGERIAALPAGYEVSYTGEAQDQAESFGFLTTALLLGVALIFLVLIAQFNSVAPPFLIMVALGLSLIGVLLGLVLLRTPFGLMTFIGLISLAGIVVNNNIVLVDYAIQLRDRGLEKTEAILEAGATRLRPVLLTALTTVIGLIPLTLGINIDFVGLVTELDPNLAFGSENTQFWGPMGSTIISGLTFATFLTLVIVPVLYSVFDSLGVRAGEVFAKRKRTAGGARGRPGLPSFATAGGDGAQGEPLPSDAR